MSVMRYLSIPPEMDDHILQVSSVWAISLQTALGKSRSGAGRLGSAIMPKKYLSKAAFTTSVS